MGRPIASVVFQHYKYLFPNEELIRYGSPHFDRKTAGKLLSGLVARKATQVNSHAVSFDLEHLLCANEAFPEAAVADPFSDLEVWDEWRSGLRCFPYPGRYSPLGIRRQEGKTQSTSSVGVVGEIMAGLYAQAGISPWVLVRVIRHWPDFIYYVGKNRYSFVEAKAYTTQPGKGRFWLNIPEKLFAECLGNAVAQLNADPYVQVWGAFTCIDQISPLRLTVTFLQLDVSNSRRDAAPSGVLPQAVVKGLAEQALRRSVLDMRGSDIEGLRQPAPKKRKLLEEILLPAAMASLEELLSYADLQTAVLASRNTIEEEIRELLPHVRLPEVGAGHRLLETLGRADNKLAKLRTVGAQTLFAAGLSSQIQTEIEQQWESRWDDANKPLLHLDSLAVWRCGGAAFAIGDSSHRGTSISGS